MERQKEQFLLFRIRAFQDQKAFETIVRELGPRIDRFLKLRVSRPEDVEDLYAEIWMRFWTYAQSTQVESVSGLIHTITRGMIAEFYQRRDRKPEPFSLTGADNEDRDVSVPVHEKLIAQVDVELLKESMRSLRDEEAELIQLRYLEGFRIKDIARQLGKTENVISVTLNRAIKKLRNSIREKFGEL